MDTEHVADNIASPMPAEEQSIMQSQASTETPKSAYVNEFLNLMQASEAIVHHYQRWFKDLKFIPPLQAMDGEIAEFVDGDSGQIIATARLRFRNRLHINPTTGDMHVGIALSDLSFQRPHISLNISPPADK